MDSFKKFGQTDRWGLLVGVNRYEEKFIGDLRFCVNDARELHDFLVSRSEHGYTPERVRLLLSQHTGVVEATQRTILKTLSKMARATGQDDLLLFYFAGHGQLIHNEAYLIPADAELDENNHLISHTGIPVGQITEIMRQAPARSKMIILDACYSGVSLDRLSSRALVMGEDFVRSVTEKAKGIAILTSVPLEEKALEHDGHGVFTYYLLEGLKAGKVTAHDIADYVTKRVEKRTKQILGKGIKPTLKYEGEGSPGSIVLLTLPGGESAPSSPPPPPPHTPPWPPDLGPVTDKKYFHNRIAELEEIKDILRMAAGPGKVIVVRGERCTGKTSLINRVKQNLLEVTWPGQRYYFDLTVEPGGISACADFAGEIWAGLRECLQRSGEQVSAELTVSFKFDTFIRFASQLKTIQMAFPHTTFVIFIDEFDKIIRQCPDLEFQKIVGLIRYLIEATDLPLVFFMTILRDLPTGYGSPFPAVKLGLRFFKQAESDKLGAGVTQGHVTLTEESLTWLHHHTNGHPYFYKLLLRYLAVGNAQPVTIEALRSASQQARISDYANEVLGDIYQNYLNNDERYIWLWLANNGGELIAAEIYEAGAQLKGAFKRLAQRDYLALTVDGGYRLQPYLQDWLKEWPEFEAEVERLQVPGPRVPLPSVELMQPADFSTAITSEGICIDLAGRRVYLEGQEIKEGLSPGGLEYRALVYLAERSGQVVSKDELASYVWQQEYYEEDDQRISAVIYRLRRLLGNQYLETLRKAGYRLQGVTLIRPAVVEARG